MIFIVQLYYKSLVGDTPSSFLVFPASICFNSRPFRCHFELLARVKSSKGIMDANIGQCFTFAVLIHAQQKSASTVHMAGFYVPKTEIYLTSNIDFLFIFGQCGGNCN